MRFLGVFGQVARRLCPSRRRCVLLMGVLFLGSWEAARSQTPFDGLDAGALRYLEESVSEFGRGGGLSSARLGELTRGRDLSSFGLSSSMLDGSSIDRATVNSLVEQYGGLIGDAERKQIESFLSPSADSFGDVDGLLESVDSVLDGGGGSGNDAEKFEALPVAAEDNVESLFQSGEDINGSLPRFGNARGEVNGNLKPFLFVPYVFQDGNFNYDAADISLRPFYLNFETLEVLSLYTDNALLSSDNQENDTVIATSLDFSLIVQISESFRLAAGASLVYLPLSNEFGFSSLGGAGLRSGLIGQTEALYEVPLGNWDLTLFDRFSVRNYSYSGGRDTGFEVFNQNDTGANGANGLVDRSLVGVDGHNVAVSQAGLNALQNQRQDRFDADGTEFQNVIGAKLSRLFPGDTRLIFQGGRSDSWFTGVSLGIPANIDQVGVSLTSERPNMRFKPTLSHSLFRSDLRPAWDRLSSLTLNGPVSEYMDLTARIGQYSPGNIESNSLLWGLDLGHAPRPSIYHSVYIEHGASGPNVDLTRDLGWQLTWTVGPYTDLDFVIEQREFLDLDGDGSGSNEFRVGTIITQELGNGLIGTFGVIYRELDFSSDLLGNNEIWTTRFRLQKRFSDSVTVGLTYQLEEWMASLEGGGFVENLVILNVTKEL